VPDDQFAPSAHQRRTINDWNCLGVVVALVLGKESFPEQRLKLLQAGPKPGCGRVGCACGLPVSERFVLWALRQWHEDRALPSDGSILHRGFKMAGLLEVLPDFAIAMDAFLFGARSMS
jgi:hypothetical protein